MDTGDDEEEEEEEEKDGCGTGGALPVLSIATARTARNSRWVLFNCPLN